MTMKIATISLLFILAIIEPVVCLAVAEQSLTLNSNGKHQSISSPAVETEYIDDSMKDDTTISSIGNVGNYITLSGSTMHPEEEIFECGSTENLHQGSFSYYDYAVVLGMLAISIGIGVFYGYFQKSGSSSNEFLLGSEMTIFPVTLSLTTSFITAIELLGNPSEMFYQGTQFALIVIPMVLVIPVAVRVFYPIYFKLELTSCYEYLGIRFGKDVRILGAILYIIQMSFYTAVAVLAPAIALSKATGLNTRLAVALIYLVCIFYSSQGGMKAVVIADTFQAGVLAFSLVLIVILGHFYTGGAWTIFEKSSEADRLEFFNFSPNPTTRHSVFSVVIGGFFYWTSLFCTNQASVQKCMSLKSLKLAKLALGFAILGLIVVFLINFYTGLMVFTHYADCDPLRSGQIGATDQLLPFYVMDVYGSIYAITGIFVAGIFAASLGTVASALNSLAAVTCEDLLINGFNVKIRPEKGATYAKWMSLGYGTFSFVLVFVVEKLGGVLQATLTLNGLVGGVTLGLFVLGITCKKANAKGAFYGGIVALVLVIYVGVMAQMTNADAKKELPISMEKCNCYINSTLTDMPGTVHNMSLIDGLMTTVTGHELINNTKDQIEAAALTAIDGDSLSSMDTEQGYSFSALYRISYIWYTAIGTILTIVFGLIISIIIDTIKARQILKIIQAEGRDEATVNSVVINASQKPSSKWNENMKAHYTSQQPELNGGKSGVDNFALKIDDEK